MRKERSDFVPVPDEFISMLLRMSEKSMAVSGRMARARGTHPVNF